ncbi:hypothetical protein [Macrococcus epidermidis]|uniref:hypothetical protein n=1 Tax=Macrococcus epidermidis TaxID=1902580 RepID=UPI0020B66A4D|nr:hypothetical protein [Macrococcus epidermidis]UTH16179.1 hypothetical protein KFV12_13155 [Macrococcus epidermidis]
MKNEDVIQHIEAVQMKLRAVSQQSYTHLDGIDKALETEWVKENGLALYLMNEFKQDSYITNVVISDIIKEVESLKEILTNNKKADSMLSDQTDTLPTE